MSKNFGKCFGPSTRDPSFRLRCPNFLLSKFVSQLKLIQSRVRVGILGICVTSSILRVLLSGFWTSGSQMPSPKDPVSGSQFQGPGSQSPRVSSLSVLESRVSGSQDPGSQGPVSQGPGFRVSGPDFRLCLYLVTYLFLFQTYLFL